MNGAFRERIPAATVAWDRLPVLGASRSRRSASRSRWFIAGAIVGAVVDMVLR